MKQTNKQALEKLNRELDSWQKEDTVLLVFGAAMVVIALIMAVILVIAFPV